MQKQTIRKPRVSAGDTRSQMWIWYFALALVVLAVGYYYPGQMQQQSKRRNFPPPSGIVIHQRYVAYQDSSLRVAGDDLVRLEKEGGFITTFQIREQKLVIFTNYADGLRELTMIITQEDVGFGQYLQLGEFHFQVRPMGNGFQILPEKGWQLLQ